MSARCPRPGAKLVTSSTASRPRNWNLDALGKHLRVSDFERAALRIYTIGSLQTPKAERIRQRKEKDRLDKQDRRRANGSQPREQSLSRTKPWEAFGIKRRAWAAPRQARTPHDDKFVRKKIRFP